MSGNNTWTLVHQPQTMLAGIPREGFIEEAVPELKA